MKQDNGATWARQGGNNIANYTLLKPDAPGSRKLYAEHTRQYLMHQAHATALAQPLPPRCLPGTAIRGSLMRPAPPTACLAPPTGPPTQTPRATAPAPPRPPCAHTPSRTAVTVRAARQVRPPSLQPSHVATKFCVCLKPVAGECPKREGTAPCPGAFALLLIATVAQQQLLLLLLNPLRPHPVELPVT